MQATVVMLIALSGLGCHHKCCEANQVVPQVCPAVCTQRLFAVDYMTMVEPSCYSPCIGPYCGGANCCGGTGMTRDGYGPASGGYVGCYAGGAIGCGCTRFPPHGSP